MSFKCNKDLGLQIYFSFSPRYVYTIHFAQMSQHTLIQSTKSYRIYSTQRNLAYWLLIWSVTYTVCHVTLPSFLIENPDILYIYTKLIAVSISFFPLLISQVLLYDIRSIGYNVFIAVFAYAVHSIHTFNCFSLFIKKTALILPARNVTTIFTNLIDLSNWLLSQCISCDLPF